MLKEFFFLLTKNYVIFHTCMRASQGLEPYKSEIFDRMGCFSSLSSFYMLLLPNRVLA